MKKILLFSLLVIALLFVVSCGQKEAMTPEEEAQAAVFNEGGAMAGQAINRGCDISKVKTCTKEADGIKVEKEVKVSGKGMVTRTYTFKNTCAYHNTRNTMQYTCPSSTQSQACSFQCQTGEQCQNGGCVATPVPPAPGQAAPAAPAPAPEAAPAQVTPTPISSCSNSVWQAGTTYVLTQDLFKTRLDEAPTGQSWCFSFDGAAGNLQGVVLDCQGRTITGAVAIESGISLIDASGVTIRNCKVNGFGIGIAINRGSSNTLNANEAYRNTFGINVRSNANTITNNNVHDNSVGITLGTGSTSNVVRGNMIQNNEMNLDVSEAPGNTVEGNTQ